MARRRYNRSLIIMSSRYLRLSRVQNLADRGGQSAPRIFLGLQLFMPASGQLIIFRSPIVLGSVPTGLNPPASFQTVKSWIQRSLLDLQRIARQLLNAFGDRPSVLRPEGYGFED